MSAITTHVLDTALGKPAVGIAIRLDKREGDSWRAISTGITDGDGRCSNLSRDAVDGLYRITFDTGRYLAYSGRTSIFPEVSITFACSGEAHYHIPLLLSDNSYTTYRGS